jgi:signal transduction histidine kinase/ActR/RegA family two-component response regulator
MRSPPRPGASRDASHAGKNVAALELKVAALAAELRREHDARVRAQREVAALRDEVARARGMFDHAPNCLWEEDLSGIKDYFDELRARGVTDLRAHFESHPEDVALCLSRVKVLDVNQAALELYEAETKIQLMTGLGKVLTPDSMALLTAQLISMAEGRTVFEGEASDQSLKGRKNHVIMKSIIAPGCERTLSRVYVSLVDVSARKHLEQQLLQSQKMDAVGQLAGGVAHDFNNLLTIIHGNVAVLQAEDVPPGLRDEALDDIVKAADRASTLTRQLLTFSRRSIPQPRALDLNEIVTGLGKMLQRLVGEHVRVQLKLAPRPLLTRADAGMLDQVLMNLVVNARDALDEGGRVVIETSPASIGAHEVHQFDEVAPGPYVCVRVSDNGRGIPPDALPHIFEPFFTTKEHGKGTGLGLSTVFGIVKQHQGVVSVSSDVGVGTTVTILLPAIEGRSVTAAGPSAQPEVRGGTESILVVEDEDQVRELVQRLLEMHGYRVTVVRNGVEALALLAQGDVAEGFDLLLTDIIMPGGVSGRDLAQRLRQDRPHTRVVFMSGYTGELSRDDLALVAGAGFLQKPFGRAALLECVRASLDGPDDVPRR